MIVGRCFRFILRLLSNVKGNLKHYCDRTSLHGFHYITQTNLFILTRIFFFIVSCSCLILCGSLIFMEIRANNHQIVTSVESTSFPVWNIPFPSVTVCNFNVVFKKNINKVSTLFCMYILNLTNGWPILTQKEMKQQHGVKEELLYDFFLNLSALFVFENIDNVDNMNAYEDIYMILNSRGYNTDQLMAELAHPCSSILKRCIWQSREYSCSELFNFVKTSHGYCCSFNYYGTLIERGVKRSFRNAHGAGPIFSLRLYLDADEEQYISPIKPAYGFDVLVQSGRDYPDMDINTNTVLMNEEVTLSVTPRVYSASPDIKMYQPQARCCLLREENRLNWVAKYSFKTCISECKANVIYELCQCIPFFYPVKAHTRICTLFDVPCLQANLYNYNALPIRDCEMANEADTFNVKPPINNNVTQCFCYPQCNEIKYEVRADKATDVNMTRYLYSNLSVLNVYYDTNGCIKIRKDVYITWDRFLGIIGGIFGLCSGGSIISVLEWFSFLFIGSGRKNTSNTTAAQFYTSDFSHHYKKKYKKSRRGQIIYY